jgi:hypothetical protein
MNLTTLDRTTLAYNCLSRLDGYNELPSDNKKTLIQIFDLGMLQMAELKKYEETLDINLRINKLKV